MNIVEALKKNGPASGKLTVTATATLTMQEVMQNFVINCTHASSAITLTLPTAHAGLKDEVLLILNGGAAAVTVNCAAYFGGTSSADNAAMTVGGMSLVYCNGTYWYILSSVLPT